MVNPDLICQGLLAGVWLECQQVELVLILTLIIKKARQLPGLLQPI